MGLFLSKIMGSFTAYFADEPARVLLIGLDAAGKTTLLYKVKLNESITTIPTIGFNVESVEPVKGLTLTVFDVGGQEKIRRLWKHYTQNVDAVVWMVDSNDQTRFAESKEELFGIIREHDLHGVPILLFANKQDLPQARSVTEITQAIGLSELRDRKWYAQGSNCITGDGVTEGFTHLAEMIREFRKTKSQFK